MALMRKSEMLEGSPLPGWSGRFFHSEYMTFAHWDIEPTAADLHEHQHPQEEVWNIVEGELVLVLEGQEWRLGPGDGAVIPPETPHSVRIVGHCRAVIADYPLRESLPGVPQL
jgi:mannose-6-phosphate isomerase-like protein (cupin superfamily)